MKRKGLYMFVVILIVLVSTMLIYVFSKEANKNQNIETTATADSSHSEEISYIPLEEVSESNEIKGENLTEITDKDLTDRLSSTLPALNSLLKGTIANKGKTDKIFRLVIPKEGGLSHKKGIDINPTDFLKVSSKTNLAMLGIQVIMEVQMNEIHSSLTSIEKTVNKISKFQEKEFASRIKTLSSEVLEISEYRNEFISDNETRKRKLDLLDNQKIESKQLLDQVNLSIEDITNENFEKYEDYQDKTKEVAHNQNTQNVLINVLKEISKLSYFLMQGKSSMDSSYESYNNYLEETTKINTTVKEWQETQVERFNINLEKGQRAKDGLEGVVSQVPGLIDEKWKYEKIDDLFLEEIQKQLSPVESRSEQPNELFDREMTMIVKEGKLYYLNDFNS